MTLERLVILNPSTVTLSKAKSLRTSSVKASAVSSAERISGKMTHYQMKVMLDISFIAQICFS